MEDMNEIQTRAFDIYINSATMDNGFTPISFKKIAEQMKKENLKSSSSSINRWANKWNWKEFLSKKISASIVEDKEVKDLIEASAIDAATQKTLDDFKANERLKSFSYQVLEAQSHKYIQKLRKGEWLTHDDEKFMLKLLEITSNREDKLLDRQALLAATKLTNSTDVLKALNDEIIDLEIEDE